MRFKELFTGTGIGLLLVLLVGAVSATWFVGGGTIDLQGGRISNLATPIANSDAATKAYVDSSAATSGDTYIKTYTLNNEAFELIVEGDSFFPVSSLTTLTSYQVIINTEESTDLLVKEDNVLKKSLNGEDSDDYEFHLWPQNNISIIPSDDNYIYEKGKYFALGGDMRGCFFNGTGTKLYLVTDDAYTDYVYEYTLSTAWDISTATLINSYSVDSQTEYAEDVFLKNDGTRMFVMARSGVIYEYDLSTAWDISTATYVTSYTTAEDDSPFGIFFKDDGTKMYIVGNQYDKIYEYDLSTAWDISTATYSASVNQGFDNYAYGLFITSDGTKMFLKEDSDPDQIREYTLSTAWDISTASLKEKTPVYQENYIIYDLWFKDDGTKIYTSGYSYVYQYQYDTTTYYYYLTIIKDGEA